MFIVLALCQYVRKDACILQLFAYIFLDQNVPFLTVNTGHFLPLDLDIACCPQQSAFRGMTAHTLFLGLALAVFLRFINCHYQVQS